MDVIFERQRLCYVLWMLEGLQIMFKNQVCQCSGNMSDLLDKPCWRWGWYLKRIQEIPRELKMTGGGVGRRRMLYFREVRLCICHQYCSLSLWHRFNKCLEIFLQKFWACNCSWLLQIYWLPKIIFEFRSNHCRDYLSPRLPGQKHIFIYIEKMYWVFFKAGVLMKTLYLIKMMWRSIYCKISIILDYFPGFWVATNKARFILSERTGHLYILSSYFEGIKTNLLIL